MTKSATAVEVAEQATMTLRDQFAMHALSGCVAYYNNFSSFDKPLTDQMRENLAMHCYSIADAMMKARRT